MCHDQLQQGTGERAGRRLAMGVVQAALVASLAGPTLGCALVVRSATTNLARNLATALIEQEDAETVRQGAPAFLLLIDGLIRSSPDDEELLFAGARLYTTYASTFVQDPERARRLADRGLRHATRGLCIDCAGVCAARSAPFDDLMRELAGTRAADVPALYGFGAAWATWISLRTDDWNAIAELPKVEAIMRRVIELDESYEQGTAHLYLGVLLAQRPASLGGRPDLARAHFERAVALSDARNLMAKVLFAREYARLVFDRELHDRLLHEVLAAEARAPGFTLSNTLAQKEARELLEAADAYF